MGVMCRCWDPGRIPAYRCSSLMLPERILENATVQRAQPALLQRFFLVTAELATCLRKPSGWAFCLLSPWKNPRGFHLQAVERAEPFLPARRAPAGAVRCSSALGRLSSAPLQNAHREEK